MAEVKLIGFWSSPYVDRVKWALKLKGVEYDYIEDDIFNKSDLLLQSNPIHKQVPILIHDGKPIVESAVILEYIEETWPHSYPLLPKDPYERAVARFWIKFADDKSNTFFSFFIKPTIEKQVKGASEAKELLKILEGSCLGNKKFFNGDEIGMIDLSFGWIACMLEFLEEAAKIQLLDANTFPRLHAWTERFKEVTMIKEGLPDYNEMLKYCKRRREMFISPVLIHDGKPIAESVVILEYIEETWPHNHPLLPKDPYERAVARFWTRFADVESYTLFAFFTAKTAEGKEKADNEAKEVLKNLEEYLGDNKFFSGDEIGMIDLCLGWIACVLELMEIAAEVKLLEADSFPRIYAWTENFKEALVIKESRPDRNKLQKYVKRQMDQLINTSTT